MMQVLVEAKVILEALLAPRSLEVESTCKLWEFMRSGEVQGFITEISFHEICRSIRYMPKAEEVISEIQSILAVLPVDLSVSSESWSFDLPYDDAINLIFAKTFNFDAVVVRSPQSFPQNAVPIYSIDELVKELHQVVENRKASLEELITFAESSEVFGIDNRKSSDSFNGGLGNNQLLVRHDDDILLGEASDDILDRGQGSDRIYGIDGNDELLGQVGDDFLDGGLGNDSLVAEYGNDQLYGQAGNDILNGREGRDRIFSTDRRDKLIVQTGDDYLAEGGGSELVTASENSRTTNTEVKDNILSAEFESDTTFSEEDDILYGGLKADTSHGSNDPNLFVLGAGTSSGIVANFAAVQDLIRLSSGLTFDRLSITQSTGSNENDFFTPVRDIEFGGADTVFGNKFF